MALTTTTTSTGFWIAISDIRGSRTGRKAASDSGICGLRIPSYVNSASSSSSGHVEWLLYHRSGRLSSRRTGRTACAGRHDPDGHDVVVEAPLVLAGP